MAFYVRKMSGEKEAFNLKKFRRSLQKAGASPHIINQIIEKIHKKHPRSTKEIHTIASNILTEQSPSIAARYNLKRALIELGPSGYPFELFISQIFKEQTFDVQTNQIILGKCVNHEVDIIAQKNKKTFIVECKFHNRLGLKTDVKDTLYIQARFEDIIQSWQAAVSDKRIYTAWVVTNTQFTSEAVKYAECRNISLLSWKKPKEKNLAQLIDTLRLHPITALQTLTQKQKRELIRNNIILCRDVGKHKGILKKFGFSDHRINSLVDEAEGACDLKPRLE